MERAPAAISLSVVLVCAAVTFGLGVAQKSPCANGEWEGSKQYRLLCYTDIVPLVGTEQLAGGRLPFLDRCVPSENNCDEYPVITMYVMRVAAWVGGTGFAGFFAANAAILAISALATAYALWRLAGRRALWFALAPTLLLYGPMNWDLVAVALSTAAMLAYASRQEEWSGGLLGLGAATKLYPALFVVPLFLQGLQDRKPDRSVRILWWSAGAWVAVNVPFAIMATTAWWEFFRFNATRAADFDSPYYLLCDLGGPCLSIRTIGVVSALAFAGLVWWTWWAKRRREPDFGRWSLGLPLLIAFLLTSKVYSPQYGLWLLPWFVLVATDLRLFVAFEVAEVAVFATRLRFFGEYAGEPWGWPESWFQAAVGLRSVVLVLILIDWVRREAPPLAVAFPRHARLGHQGPQPDPGPPSEPAGTAPG